MTAPAELPNEEQIRVLTASPDLTPGEANRHGDLFLDAGKLLQAMLFYERSRDRGRLERVRDAAVRDGDAFLLHWITRLDPEVVTPAEWREAGDRATREGKFVFARDCYEKAGDPEKAQAAHAEWLKLFPAPPPAAG